MLGNTLGHVGHVVVEGEVVGVGGKELLALHGERGGERVEVSVVAWEPQVEALKCIDLGGLLVLLLAVLLLFVEVGR